MGLDMFLNAKRYLSEWDKEEKSIRDSISPLVPNLGKMVIKEIVAEAAYWRKANAIHSWFVENVQDGKDECVEHYVGREQLKELIETCKMVLADRDNPISSKAEKLLPTQSGFFFGDTEYDEYYFQDLQGTIDQLEPLLTEEYKNWEFYYRSSW